MTKLYEVIFNHYTNYSDEYVRNEKTKSYLDTSEPVIITEEQIPHMKHWGGGIKTLKYVGVLAFESDDMRKVLEIIDKLNHNGSISVKLLQKELKVLKGEVE